MEKAVGGPADVVIFDLEDAVAEAEKPRARDQIAAFLAAQPVDRSRLWVRINPLQGPHALADLAAVIPSRPGGIMLPKSRRGADVERLDHFLSDLEAAAGIEQGATAVIALVTETAQSMFTTGTYAGAPRLAALTWGAEDLAAAVGATDNRNADGSYVFLFEMARSFCLLGAAAAGVAAVETGGAPLLTDSGPQLTVNTNTAGASTHRAAAKRIDRSIMRTRSMKSRKASRTPGGAAGTGVARKLIARGAPTSGDDLAESVTSHFRLH